MFRWETVDQESNGLKLYRSIENYVYTTIDRDNIEELDDVAYKYLNSELYMYKVLDLNFIDYMENRGVVRNMTSLKIPKE